MFAPSQTTSHRPTRAAGLRLSYWHWLRHVGTCQAFHAYTHPRTETHTRLLSSSLVLWNLNTSLQWRSMASGEDGVGGETIHRWRLVDLFILLKPKNVYFFFLYISDCIFPNAQQQSAVPFQSGLGDKSHRNCPQALNPEYISLMQNIFSVIHSFALKCPLWLDCCLI